MTYPIQDAILPVGVGAITAEQIITITAKFSGVTTDQILGYSREREIVTSRHVAMYLVRKHCGHSLCRVGRIFNRDHATVIHAERRIRKLVEGEASACEGAGK
jgi:chromosomal replication initiator protein